MNDEQLYGMTDAELQDTWIALKKARLKVQANEVFQFTSDRRSTTEKAADSQETPFLPYVDQTSVGPFCHGCGGGRRVIKESKTLS